MSQIIEFFLSLDQHLLQGIAFFGPYIYVILFLIIFAETGLVITPFLPGDSLLFALGALTVVEGGLDLSTLMISLIIAAIIGDAVNYYCGSYFGDKVFSTNSRFFKKKHLDQTKEFYDKWGSFTIVAARFAPIVRTFAPFVAGVGKMPYKKFLIYNVFGAVVWVSTFLLAGHFFGNIPAIKKNFQLVIFAIIIISVIPILIPMIKTWLEQRKQQAQ